METPLLLKIMLSWAIMIFCFTALFAGSHKVNEENFTTEIKEDESDKATPATEIKPMNHSNKTESKIDKVNPISGGSALNVNHRDKDQH